MAAKKGLWSVPGAVEAETKATADPAEAAGAEVGDDSGGKPPHSGPSLRGDEERCVARVCGVVSGTHFYVHVQAPSRVKQLEAIEQALAGAGEKLDGVPKKGQLVLVDGRRARVEAVAATDKDDVKVFFVDHGTRATVAADAVAALPVGVKALAAPPQAVECSLGVPRGARADRRGRRGGRRRRGRLGDAGRGVRRRRGQRQGPDAAGAGLRAGHGQAVHGPVRRRRCRGDGGGCRGHGGGSSSNSSSSGGGGEEGAGVAPADVVVVSE